MSSKTLRIGLGSFLVVAIAGVWLLLDHEGRVAAPEVTPGTTAQNHDTVDPAGPAAHAEVTKAAKPEAGATSGERTDVRTAPAAVKRLKITGRLIDEQSAPIADLGVIVDPARGIFARGQRDTKPRATSGKDGRFEFWLDASAPGGDLALGDPKLVFASDDPVRIDPAGRDLELGDLRVETGAVLAGLVRDAAMAPLAGVKIRITRHAEEPIWFGFGGEHAVTGADGRFRFEGLRSGGYRLATASSRHVPATHKVELKHSENKQDVVIELREGGYVAGTILDDLGRPLASARVSAMRQRGGEFLMIEGLGINSGEGAETDASGRFFLGGLEEERVALRVTCAHHASATKREVLLRSTDVVVQLKRHGSIEGVLTDTAGKPIAGSEVDYSPRGSGLIVRGPGFDANNNKTADDGSFTLTDVPAGTVRVTAQGDQHVDTEPVAVEVVPGAATRGVKLTAQRGATIEALVVDGDGKPVEGAEVLAVKPGENANAALPGGASFRSARRVRRVGNGSDIVRTSGEAVEVGSAKTDAEGKARISGLAAGDVVVKVKHSELVGTTPARLSLPAVGVVTTRLATVRGGFVDVTVVDADGAPAKQQPILVEPKDATPEDALHHRADNAGKARVGPLAPGDYSATLKVEPRPVEMGGARIMLANDDRKVESATRPFTVREGETVELTLHKPLSAKVTGIVTDADGPVAGAQVSLDPEGQPNFGFGGGYGAKTDKRGQYTIQDAPPGKYTISWSRGDAPIPFEQPLELLDGEREVKRNLHIGGGIVKVTVVGNDGAPLRGAKVKLNASSRNPGRTRQVMMFTMAVDSNDGEALSFDSAAGRPVTTDEDGVATIRDVPPGKYELAIDHARHIPQTRPDVVAEEGTTTDAGSVKLVLGGQIRGTIVGADGTALSGFGMGQVHYQKIGAKGDPKQAHAMNYVFKLNGLEPGKYRLWTLSFDPEDPNKQTKGEEVEVEVKGGETANVQVRQGR